MSDLDPTEIFREEAAELMEQLEVALLDLERTPQDQALIDKAFRALHTIKGSGAMFGFDRVASFIHDFETAFDHIRKGRAEASHELIKVALEAKDHIRLLVDAPDRAGAKQGAAILAALARVTKGPGVEAASAQAPGANAPGAQALNDQVSGAQALGAQALGSKALGAQALGAQALGSKALGSKPPGAEAPSMQAPSAPSPAIADAAPEAEVAATWRLDMAFDSELLVNGSNPLLMFDELRDLGDCRLDAAWENVPPLADLRPQSLYFTWSAELTTTRPIAALEEVFMFVLDDMRLEATRVEPSSGAAAPQAPAISPVVAPAAGVAARKSLPASLEIAPVADAEATSAPGAARGNKESATIRVQAERLDEMMDRVGELVIVQARLSQIAAGTDETIKSVAEDIARLTSGLREAVMGIRMVPIGSLFVRFRRLLHDLARDLDKEIELVTIGDETELDKTMIERLADPLVHVIRNAADHGLETPADRVAAGKGRKGQIKLVARHAGAEVLVSISDDGRGLDARRIRQKAEEQGLVQPGAAMADADLYPLIFHPGFSTAKEVSALSGRGVGMDVVKKTIEAMRGSVDIATALNKGTTITFRLPLTLAIIEGLLVRVADTRYVIPLTAVEECVELSNTDNTRSEGRSFLNIRGDLIPFLRLRELFNEPGESDVFQKVVIVSTGDTRVGLVVDQIIGSHQTVIKSLSKLHADVNTFSGATILGDGAVALILDILHIVALGQTLETRHKASRMEHA